MLSRVFMQAMAESQAKVPLFTLLDTCVRVCGPVHMNLCAHA